MSLTLEGSLWNISLERCLDLENVWNRFNLRDEHYLVSDVKCMKLSKIQIIYLWQNRFQKFSDHIIDENQGIHCETRLCELIPPLLKGQYHHDQQGMESECEFWFNSVTENNTLHNKVIFSHF